MHEQRFCFASLLIFAVLVAVRSLSLLKPPILYCLLGYWHLIKNCADTSENKRHCKFKSIQLLMEPSPTTSLLKEPHQSGFEIIFSP